jgi:hypothetical protein
MTFLSEYQGFLGAAYLWVKAAHVTFVIFWIAGLFIVPRYYIHHQATTPGPAEDRAWIEREDKAVAGRYPDRIPRVDRRLWQEAGRRPSRA